MLSDKEYTKSKAFSILKEMRELIYNIKSKEKTRKIIDSLQKVLNENEEN